MINFRSWHINPNAFRIETAGNKRIENHASKGTAKYMSPMTNKINL